MIQYIRPLFFIRMFLILDSGSSKVILAHPNTFMHEPFLPFKTRNINDMDSFVHYITSMHTAIRIETPDFYILIWH